MLQHSAAPKPDFKPRVQKDKSKYKKKPSDDTYRDRAAERRTGGPNDFAEAEKLLEVSYGSGQRPSPSSELTSSPFRRTSKRAQRAQRLIRACWRIR